MTTGRINQITRMSGGGGPPGCDPRAATTPRPPPGGGQSVYQEGARGAPDPRGSPGVPGTTRAAIQLPPLSPSAPVRTQIDPSPRYGRRGVGLPCGIRPSGGGSGPHSHAGERRIPRGGSLQESWCQVWPAAIRPQTPSAPGTTRFPGFGRRGVTHRAPREGRRRAARGG